MCVWIIARSGLARGTSLVVRARCQIAAGSMQHACCKATSGPLVLQQANPLSFICTSFQRPQPKLSPPSPLPIKMSAPPLAQSYRVLKAVRKPLQRVLPLPPHQSEIRAPSEFPIVHPPSLLRFEVLGRFHRHYRLLMGIEMSRISRSDPGAALEIGTILSMLPCKLTALSISSRLCMILTSRSIRPHPTFRTNMSSGQTEDKPRLGPPSSQPDV